MAKSFISEKAIFPVGKQTALLMQIVHSIGMQRLLQIANISRRTLTEWKRERSSIPLKTVEKLAQVSGIQQPPIQTKNLIHHLASISKKGAAARTQKHGDLRQYEKQRQRRWREWWNTKGKQLPDAITKPKSILKPAQSVELAEFIGIMMGDGTVAPYHIAISLNRETDASYGKFICMLIQKLFGVIPKIYKDTGSMVCNIVVQRKLLVKFCVLCGLPQGNKVAGGLDIPPWIKRNYTYLTACIRGLVDTDGSVFTHTYRVKGNVYHYKKLSFTSTSKPLIQSMYVALKDMGMHPRITRNGKDIRLDRIDDIKLYFCLIGSSNPKHLGRYKS